MHSTDIWRVFFRAFNLKLHVVLVVVTKSKAGLVVPKMLQFVN